MRVRIRIENGRELAEAISKLEKKAAKAVLRDGIEAGGELLAAEMASLAPKDTGELAESIKPVSRKSTPIQASVDVGPTGEVFHGLFHEFGTKKMPAHPFMVPAAEAKREEIVGAIIDAMRKAVEGK